LAPEVFAANLAAFCGSAVAAVAARARQPPAVQEKRLWSGPPQRRASEDLSIKSKR
jgi:hypothetical protein